MTDGKIQQIDSFDKMRTSIIHASVQRLSITYALLAVAVKRTARKDNTERSFILFVVFNECQCDDSINDLWWVPIRWRERVVCCCFQDPITEHGSSSKAFCLGQWGGKLWTPVTTLRAIILRQFQELHPNPGSQNGWNKIIFMTDFMHLPKAYFTKVSNCAHYIHL